MSSIGKFDASVMCGRVNKVKNAVAGFEHAGVYYPGFTKPDGSVVQARWEGVIFINNLPFTGKDGVKKESKPLAIKVTAWNSANSTPGHGIADICAKSLSPGKEVSCKLTASSYEKRIYVDGVPQVDHKGNPLFDKSAVSFTMDGLPIFGNEADAVIMNEINAFRTNGIAATFGARPTYWNVIGHADKLIWEKIKTDRRDAVYVPGQAMYGYAKVIVNSNAVPAANANAALLQQMAEMQAQLAALNQTPAAQPTPIAPPAQPNPATLGMDPVMLAQMMEMMKTFNQTPVVPQAQAAGATTTAAAGLLNNVPI